MLLKFKIWWQKKRIEAAKLHAEEQRMQWHYAQTNLIPAMEEELRKMQGASAYKTFHPKAQYQWGGRLSDRLPLDGKTKPIGEDRG